MKGSDIKRYLDLEFTRLKNERAKQEKEDEELAEFILEEEKLHRQLVTVVKGSSVAEFQQNWKEKVEAN